MHTTDMAFVKSTGIALFLLVAFAIESTAQGFDRYQVILNRKPFGVPAPPAPVQQAPVNPAVVPSFARNFRLSMIIREDNGELKVGIVNLADNSGMSLLVGDIENGIELVSADYDAEEAVLRRGAETALIKLSGAEAASIPNSTPSAPSRPQVRAPQRPSLPTRRISSRPASITPPASPAPANSVTPKYKGAELKKHLENYQMEVIRQGLPPLPIPLTPEQDDQLVREGVLPPVP